MKDRSQHIETLFAILLGMAAFYLLFDRIELLYIGLGVAGVGYLIPVAGKWIHLGWHGLSKVLGFINTHIILSVMYFVVLSPLALLRRLFGSDKLMLRKRDTYWTDRSHRYTARDIEKPW